MKRIEEVNKKCCSGNKWIIVLLIIILVLFAKMVYLAKYCGGLN